MYQITIQNDVNNPGTLIALLIVISIGACIGIKAFSGLCR